jgi:hypothetical protein
VPEWRRCAKKILKKAQSPGIRGFGVFGIQIVINEPEASCVGFMPDAGSWCIEAVHGAGTL